MRLFDSPPEELTLELLCRLHAEVPKIRNNCLLASTVEARLTSTGVEKPTA